jgi:hypothetical protein
VEQLLWAEIIFKFVSGAALVLAPLSLSSLLGLERPETGFWPRIIGAITIGIAVGIWIGLRFPTAKGAIGPGGLIPINLAVAGALIAPLILGKAARSRRGKLVIFVTAVLLLALAFLEIAHV